MDFNETIKDFAGKIESRIPSIQTEEATKMSLIVPLFQLLGYDVFNPMEFCPEYTADVGIKKGEKVDYAILSEDGSPIVLIECKACTENLDKYGSQLFRYFATTSAKFGILTNGIIYRFYTDLEETNKMDLVPFLELDMLNLNDSKLAAFKKFCKGDFDSELIFSAAEEMKYTSMIRSYISSQLNTPSEAFVRLTISDFYSGLKNQKVIEKFTPIVKKAFSGLITELVNQKISLALEDRIPQEKTSKIEVTNEISEEETATPAHVASKINTTETEIEAFYMIKGMLVGIASPEDITYKDTESYFGILYKNNTRKSICRLYIEKKNKYIMIPNESKNYTKYPLEVLNDLYNYKNLIVESLKRYL